MSHFIQTRNVTLHTNTECHASQRPNLLQFIATRDAYFLNLLSRPKILLLQLLLSQPHTRHHKLFLLLYIW